MSAFIWTSSLNYSQRYCQNCCYEKFITTFWPIALENLTVLWYKADNHTSGMIDKMEFWHWYRKSIRNSGLPTYMREIYFPHLSLQSTPLHKITEQTKYKQKDQRLSLEPENTHTHTNLKQFNNSISSNTAKLYTIVFCAFVQKWDLTTFTESRMKEDNATNSLLLEWILIN